MSNYFHNNLYKEKISTDNFEMPIRYYYSDSTNGDDKNMSAHWHNEMEIQFFVKGSANIIINNNEVNVKENEILIIPSQAIHFGYSEAEILKVHTIVFHTEVLCPQNREQSIQKYFNPFINCTANIDYVIHPNSTGYNDIKKTVLGIINTVEKKPICYELIITSYLMKFFITLYENNYVTIEGDNLINDKNYLIVRDTIEYIKKNYNQPLTVEQLAINAGFSKSRFMSIFKEYTNTTCKKYINQYRLDSALQLLKNTDNTVLNIAIASGYNNISLFNREFKKLYNVTPLEYRKKHRKKLKI